MVLVSQEYLNNLQHTLGAERLRIQELEEAMRGLQEELSLLKVSKASYGGPPPFKPQHTTYATVVSDARCFCGSPHSRISIRHP